MALLALVAILLAVAIWRSFPHDAAVANSRVVLTVPRTWESTDAKQAFDAGWAAEQKRRYPADAALIESLLEGLRSGEVGFYARIDVDGDRVPDGSVIATVSDDDARLELLRLAAERSVVFQPVQVRGGTTAADVTLATGPAVRLDWSYDLRHADGTSDIEAVRSYWLIDGTKTIVIQLTMHAGQPSALADFEAVIRTVRWGS